MTFLLRPNFSSDSTAEQPSQGLGQTFHCQSALRFTIVILWGYYSSHNYWHIPLFHRPQVVPNFLISNLFRLSGFGFRLFRLSEGMLWFVWCFPTYIPFLDNSKILDFMSICFWKIKILSFGGQNRKISKIRDSQIVALSILRLLALTDCVLLHTCTF